MKQTANREHYKPMKANFCYEQEDRRLQAGQEVVVCWRANGYAHHVLAQVVALTRLQVTVVLFSAPGGEDRYRAGDQLTIPRYATGPNGLQVDLYVLAEKPVDRRISFEVPR